MIYVCMHDKKHWAVGLFKNLGWNWRVVCFAGLLHLLIGGWVGRGFTPGELVWYRLLSNVLA